jgi:predicted transcriptional regulator
MLRLFQEEATALRGKKFLAMVEERQRKGEPLKIQEWKPLLVELNVSRSAFYAMRNKLLGAGLISNKGGEYRLSGMFSRDLMDMARWWWTAVLGNNLENL